MTATVTALTDTHATVNGARLTITPHMRWFLSRELGRELDVVVANGALKEAALPCADPCKHGVFCPQRRSCAPVPSESDAAGGASGATSESRVSA